MVIQIHTLEVGPLATCCYLVHASDEAEAAIIDPGGDAEVIAGELEKRGLTAQAFWLTHSHFDHVGALQGLKERFPEVPICCHSECNKLMQSPQTNLAGMIGAQTRTPAADQEIAPGDQLSVGSLSFDARHAPGHAPGHLVFFETENRVVFSGDTLFNGSLGRTDFPGSSYDLLAKSVLDQLLSLPDETRVYPGHGPHTTIGREKRHNPFIRNMLAAEEA